MLDTGLLEEQRRAVIVWRVVRRFRGQAKNGNTFEVGQLTRRLGLQPAAQQAVAVGFSLTKEFHVLRTLGGRRKRQRIARDAPRTGNGFVLEITGCSGELL